MYMIYKGICIDVPCTFRCSSSCSINYHCPFLYCSMYMYNVYDDHDHNAIYTYILIALFQIMVKWNCHDQICPKSIGPVFKVTGYCYYQSIVPFAIQAGNIHKTSMVVRIVCYKLMWYITKVAKSFYITLTSWWARRRLKSPASRLFTQPFIRAQIKENIKAPRHWPLCGNSPHKWPVMRKMFPFDDVIMVHWYL